GYDPVEKQYKVLSVTWSKGSKEYQVLTLGIGEPSWRIIKCCRPNIYHPLHKGVCINGVLYYICTITGVLKDSMIVCFDFKSEKFRFIEEGDANLHFVGVTQTNEIVLASSFSVPFDLFYYNMEKKTMIRLQIQGMEDFP
ncbi:F-box associated interaction domain, partial [Arabidopsis thaliana x Arabidopsis arenosa]